MKILLIFGDIEGFRVQCLFNFGLFGAIFNSIFISNITEMRSSLMSELAMCELSIINTVKYCHSRATTSTENLLVLGVHLAHLILVSQEHLGTQIPLLTLVYNSGFQY